MSLFRIILYAMALGVCVGVLVSEIGALTGRDLPAGPMGMAVTLFSVLIAGTIQPPPKKR